MQTCMTRSLHIPFHNAYHRSVFVVQRYVTVAAAEASGTLQLKALGTWAAAQAYEIFYCLLAWLVTAGLHITSGLLDDCDVYS